MIGALRKIAGHSEVSAPRQVQEMFLDHSEESGFARWFSTHPSIDDRVAALVKFAGGHDAIPPDSPLSPDERPKPPEFGRRLDPPGPDPAATGAEPPAGPWGRPQD
jgi:heat shock protein HtpX